MEARAARVRKHARNVDLWGAVITAGFVDVLVCPDSLPFWFDVGWVVTFHNCISIANSPPRRYGGEYLCGQSIN